MSQSNEILTGQHAKQLLEDPVLKRALEELEKQYVEAWKATSANDNLGRERLFHAVQCVEHFRDHLRIMIERGALSSAHIERLRSRTSGNE